MAKFIFVTGGVVSGLGKGITAASLGRLLKCRGLKVTSQKLDPYMNIDPGTMSPFQHGEVFVTDDGAETDLDLGHYERFIDENLGKYSNLTSGRVYWNVLNKERNGDYLGQTVQIIPHVTNEIKDFVLKNAQNADVGIVEVGGTIGDIESQPFLEAIRQLALEVGRRNCLFIHVCLVPYISGSDEFKSKPTQHSVKELMSVGIHPDIIVARCDKEIPDEIRKKISLFCNVSPDCVINNTTCKSLYEVPLMLHAQNMDDVACRDLGIEKKTDYSTLADWSKMVETINARSGEVQVALVGKYVKLHDSYLSIVESLNHASFVVGKNVKIKWVDSDSVTDQSAAEVFAGCAGIILPGGFGQRGVEGMIASCRYARTHKIPYFGICLGMQIAVIEFARSVLELADANSREFDEACEHPVIDLMKNQEGVIMGGTMRLGSYPCKVTAGTLLDSAYGKEIPKQVRDDACTVRDDTCTVKDDTCTVRDDSGSYIINERHRHRYEFNNDYREQMQAAGLVISGVSPDGTLVEAVEVADHFHIGVQFHPEFKSRPNKPSPLFVDFLKACL